MGKMPAHHCTICTFYKHPSSQMFNPDCDTSSVGYLSHIKREIADSYLFREKAPAWCPLRKGK